MLLVRSLEALRIRSNAARASGDPAASTAVLSPARTWAMTGSAKSVRQSSMAALSRRSCASRSG